MSFSRPTLLVPANKASATVSNTVASRVHCDGVNACPVAKSLLSQQHQSGQRYLGGGFLA